MECYALPTQRRHLYYSEQPCIAVSSVLRGRQLYHKKISYAEKHYTHPKFIITPPGHRFPHAVRADSWLILEATECPKHHCIEPVTPWHRDFKNCLESY
jgi:hypothetical protein